MAIFKADQLLNVCNAEQTQDNICIAQTIINIYMQSKNFFTENMIDCMKTFLVTGILDFARFNIQF
jgi:adenine deaminase